MPRTRIKFCGLTHPDDVIDAVEAGADAVGFNFYPKSPRFIDARAAGPLIRRVPPFVDAVGVFVETPVRQMCAVAYQLGLRSIQWVGDESPPNEDTFPFPMIASYRVRSASDLTHISLNVHLHWSSGNPLGAVLIDAHVPGQYGGTGQAAPWELLKDWYPGMLRHHDGSAPESLQAEHPRWNVRVPLILAGGLTPENVAAAVRAVRPYGVDVASGVESSPGRKDADKMRRFVDGVRAAE
jgi:phosphoribosylanthranilate isomerase